MAETGQLTTRSIRWLRLQCQTENPPSASGVAANEYSKIAFILENSSSEHQNIQRFKRLSRQLGRFVSPLIDG